MFEPIVKYLAGEYVTNNNSDISDCIYDTVTDDNFEKCNIEPMKTHLTINKKMYKKFNEYKKKAEKFEADYTNFIKDLEDMVLISDKIERISILRFVSIILLKVFGLHVILSNLPILSFIIGII